MTEIWATVPGYGERYDVSDQGRVRSWAATGRSKTARREHPRLLSLRVYRPKELTNHRFNPDAPAYMYVTLVDLQGRKRPKRVHTLVLLAFVGAKPLRHEGRHLDGDGLNNHRENLAWGTPQQNSDDKARHGRSNRGERHGHAKATASKVERIRQLDREGLSYSAIAERVQLPKSTVTHIAHGDRWRHLALTEDRPDKRRRPQNTCRNGHDKDAGRPCKVCARVSSARYRRNQKLLAPELAAGRPVLYECRALEA